MRRVDLGEGAVAFEANSDADRVDQVSDTFFTRYKISEEATQLYRRYRSSVQSAPTDAGTRSRTGAKD